MTSNRRVKTEQAMQSIQLTKDILLAMYAVVHIALAY